MEDLPAYTGEAIRADSLDPDFHASPAFSSRLRQMGVAQPNPTFSSSSTAAPSAFETQNTPGPSYPSSSNTTLSVLEARRKRQYEATAEFDRTGRSTDQGREFLDVGTIRDILMLRDQGIDAAAIESKFNLKTGVVKRLGPMGVVSALGG